MIMRENKLVLKNCIYKFSAQMYNYKRLRPKITPKSACNVGRATYQANLKMKGRFGVVSEWWYSHSNQTVP